MLLPLDAVAACIVGILGDGGAVHGRDLVAFVKSQSHAHLPHNDGPNGAIWYSNVRPPSSALQGSRARAVHKAPVHETWRNLACCHSNKHGGQSRSKHGRGEPGPSADVAGPAPGQMRQMDALVPALMWLGLVPFQRHCHRGGRGRVVRPVRSRPHRRGRKGEPIFGCSL